MPAQKRSYETHPEEDDSPQADQSHHEQAEDGDESDGTPSRSGGEKDEFVIVKLAEIRKEVQCPICLGIIRKTRTVMECLHRFCRECIDKSMRLGNNECPACRTHCASRRSLRDDPNYDALIAALYPDIDKYEEEELAFHEEEKARNKQCAITSYGKNAVRFTGKRQNRGNRCRQYHSQSRSLLLFSVLLPDLISDVFEQIQASITQTFRRQSDALGRKRATARATAAAFVRRSQGNYRNLRGRRNHRAFELQGSEDDEDANGNDGGKDSSSADERCTEVKPKRCKRWGGARLWLSQPSSAATSADGVCDENYSEVNRESVGASVGLVGSSEMLAWGKGGMRSHNRHGSLSGGNGKIARNSRLSKFIDFLRNLGEKDDVSDIHLKLVSLDEERVPSLQRPHLCCRPTLSVRHLHQYVALQTPLQAEDIEILVVKELLPYKLSSSTSASVSISKSSVLYPCKDEFLILKEEETMAGLQARCNFSRGHLLLAYRQKSSGLGNS